MTFEMERRLESRDEDETIAWAENNGWVARPMAYRGRRGCPDTWFFGFGRILPIEFKRKGGGELSGNQVSNIKIMRKQGIEIPVFDDAADAIAYLKGFMP